MDLKNRCTKIGKCDDPVDRIDPNHAIMAFITFIVLLAIACPLAFWIGKIWFGN